MLCAKCGAKISGRCDEGWTAFFMQIDLCLLNVRVDDRQIKYSSGSEHLGME